MDGAGARRIERKHVLLNASIISAEGTQEVRIKDLSVSGVKVRCDVPLAVDRDVIFKRGHLFHAARVAWAYRDEAGLEFYRKLDPSSVGTEPR